MPPRPVINLTIPASHHPVTTDVLFACLPVLGENATASTVTQGMSLAAVAELTGQLFIVSPSRRSIATSSPPGGSPPLWEQ
ncbi:hypothetical protein [Arthrobacter sp. 92]|uniref:hypothetical protein n=1 Tax=Arthrobacter sp. 92 TaxID=3418175 RepID=UPI003D05413F